MPDDDAGDGEDWVVLSSHRKDEGTFRPNSLKDAYLDLQFQTRFGTFSLFAGPIRGDTGAVDTRTGDSENAQEQSIFFRLPVEIRLYLYEHLLWIPASDSAENMQHIHECNRSPGRLTILLTCRRALKEAEGIYYSINRLRPEQPLRFLASLGVRRRFAITKFTLVVGSAASVLPRLKQLHRLPNLTSLHVQRTASVKYQDVTSWAIMTPQLIASIREMKALKELKILTPEARDVTEHDLARKGKLIEIDRKLLDSITA